MDAPSRPGPWWAQLLGVGGFVTLFGVVALAFGLWFGVQLLRAQRDGIESINRMQDVQVIQARQHEALEARLERIERALGTGP